MIFGLFLPYCAADLGIGASWKYPKEFRKIKTFATKREQLDAYANTPCPASQMFDAEDEEEFERKIEILNSNFDDLEWLKENIFPYV